MTGTINLDTWGNTAQMCRRATADLFHRKFVIFLEIHKVFLRKTAFFR